MSSPPGDTSLSQLLAAIDPALDPIEYAFASCPDGDPIPGDVIAWFREREGITCVLPRASAARQYAEVFYPCRRIELRVASSLDAIGLLAAVTKQLAEAGVSVNAFSALHHDHLFVPSELADVAMLCLREMGR